MPSSEKFFCSDLAWEYGIPLTGTATRGDVWFLLEYTKRWEAKAFAESSLSQEVKDHLDGIHYPGMEVRTLLIRQEKPQLREELRFFVGVTHPLEPRLYEYSLDDYNDLLQIDLASLIARHLENSTYLRKEPLYLVCTNGKRDQCCSIYGPEIYQAMREEAGDSVWQSSHIGGHNQAPITLFFPHGVNYAHATTSEIRRLIQAYKQRKVILHNLRGRVCFEQPVQAAEHFWREQFGNLDLPGIQVESMVEIAKNEWLIDISGIDGQNKVQIHIQRQFSDYEIPITCTQKKTAPISSFHRVA